MLETIGPGPLTPVGTVSGIYAKGVADPNKIIHNFKEVLTAQELAGALGSFQRMADHYRDLEVKLSTYEPGLRQYELLKAVVDRARIKLDEVEYKVTDILIRRRQRRDNN